MWKTHASFGHIIVIILLFICWQFFLFILIYCDFFPSSSFSNCLCNKTVQRCAFYVLFKIASITMFCVLVGTSRSRSCASCLFLTTRLRHKHRYSWAHCTMDWGSPTRHWMLTLPSCTLSVCLPLLLSVHISLLQEFYSCTGVKTMIIVNRITRRAQTSAKADLVRIGSPDQAVPVWLRSPDQADPPRIRQIWPRSGRSGPDRESGSGRSSPAWKSRSRWLPEFNGELSTSVEKCLTLHCWGILKKCPRCRRRSLPKFTCISLV